MSSRKDRSFISLDYLKLQAGDVEISEVLTAYLLPDDSKGFKIRYTIFGDQIREPIRRVLNVRFTTQSEGTAGSEEV